MFAHAHLPRTPAANNSDAVGTAEENADVFADSDHSEQASRAPAGCAASGPNSPCRQTARTPRASKYGRCTHCDRALRPVIHATGRQAGQLLLRCSRWWGYDGHRRLCWHFSAWDPNVVPWLSLPASIRQEYCSLVARLARGGRPSPGEKQG